MTERELFVAAMELEDAESRSAFLNRQCAERPELRQRIDGLLRAHGSANGFLENGIVPSPEPISTAGGPIGFDTPLVGDTRIDWDYSPGAIIAGRYKLKQEVGVGGMGRVWLAEQTQPVRRDVAVKLIKAGMDSQHVLARFEAERQALALMEHPNIAKVLDGGVTEAGRPYFVMELVSGLPITTYCTERQLPLRDRLRLFLPVCQAVQHAHQKGILHRDLKPSNILVVSVNNEPTPKIIDFGLAKALQSSHLLKEETLLTAAGTVIGTPIYMAPEQTKSGAHHADTRTDVYTLGVILYELLTGRTPIEKAHLQGLAWDEICRVIREVEPPRPTAIRIDLDSDLDWIVLKALEKDPERRYESASALAADIDRYLSDDAISARPPSEIYRIGKFVRRHRGAVVAASLILATLVGALIATSWSLRRAESAAEAERKARSLAVERLTQVETANEILDTMFQALDPQSERLDGQTLNELLAQRVQEAAASLEQSQIDDREMIARLQNSVGRAKIGLGDPRKAIELLTSASQTFSELYGEGDRRTIMCRNSLARALDDTGDVKPALELLRDTQARMAAQFGFDDRDAMSASNNLGMALLRAGLFDEAVPLLERTLARRRSVFGPSSQPAQVAESNLAWAYNSVGQFARALAMLEPLVEKRLASLGPEHPRTTAALEQLARSYRGIGQKQKGVDCLERALAGRRSVVGLDHVETLKCQAHLASAYKDAGQLDRALPLYEQTLPKLQAKLGADHPETLVCMNNYAMAWWVSEHQEKALTMFEQLVGLTTAKLGVQHLNSIKAIGNLGVMYRDAQRYDEAVKTLSQAQELIRKQPMALQVLCNFIPCALADTLNRIGEYEKSIPVHRVAVDMTRRREGDDHGFTRIEVGRLALVMVRTGKYAEAEPILKDCLERSERVDSEHWLTYCVRAMLGVSLAGQGKLAEAEPLIESGYFGMKQRQEKIHPKFRGTWFTILLDSLVQVYESAKKPEEAAKWRVEKTQWEVANP